MNIIDLAKKLNELDLQYPTRLPAELVKEAKEAGLVIVYGASDDLMEFEGGVYDELGVYDGGTAYLNELGLITNDCEEEDCPYFKQLMKLAKTIKACWCEEDDISWTYKTEIPHELFEVKEDDGIYCHGLVFKLSDV